MAKLAVRALQVAVVAALLALVFGGDWGFTPGELEAKQRFEAVGVGATEAGILAALGPPSAVVTKDGESPASGAPALWRAYLPERAIASKVLVYVDGTVYAFYYVDARGRVEFAAVHFS